ncbi:hypothetical protein I79_022788 [Cricetulus griseus]|uniref:Uncharacterized protein n=1 Tax=Cricetulus griseus TaxID=10029 RepID=G3IGA5_CRIGR|nr:hypothetical protein I79_022788 [Cricetulus griseus]
MFKIFCASYPLPNGENIESNRSSTPNNDSTMRACLKRDKNPPNFSQELCMYLLPSFTPSPEGKRSRYGKS